ncbi:LysE family transporter [Gracilimonas sp.]|uniref:LysE family translocator n=1 Tax=Gracilimonas sp. TaxID=1974203 RepID=UPI0032EEBF4B
MNTIHFWETFVLLIGLHFSAGPANILMATSVTRQGIKGTLPVFLGLWVPIIIYTLLTGFVLKEFIKEFILYINLVSILGAVYIIYLSYKLFTSPIEGDKATKNENHFTFKDGFILNALNGKLFVSLALVFSVGLTTESSSTGVIIIIATFIVLGLLANASWGVGGKLLSTVAGNHHQQKLNIIYSLLLLGVGLWILFDVLMIII